MAAGAIDTLFARFDAELKRQGYFALGGQIIEASIVEAPKQRLSAEEKRHIRDGDEPPWPPVTARQKDIEVPTSIAPASAMSNSGYLRCTGRTPT